MKRRSIAKAKVEDVLIQQFVQKDGVLVYYIYIIYYFLMLILSLVK